jgi:hypothetical protein
MYDVSFLGCRVDPATEPVPGPFVNCAVETLRQVQRWLDGQDEQTVLAALRDCTVTGDDGRIWAYGASSNRWFVRDDNGTWAESHPTLAAVE